MLFDGVTTGTSGGGTGELMKGLHIALIFRVLAVDIDDQMEMVYFKQIIRK